MYNVAFELKQHGFPALPWYQTSPVTEATKLVFTSVFEEAVDDVQKDGQNLHRPDTEKSFQSTTDFA